MMRGHASPGRTVMIVEDHRRFRTVLRRFLEVQGFTVLEAADGEEALLLATDHEEPIDLLLVDIVLPDSSGSNVAQHMRVSHPEVKLIYMSGHSETDTILRGGIQTEHTPFLAKPFEMAELMELIDRVLAEASEEAAGS